jgi:hypothetical protein
MRQSSAEGRAAGAGVPCMTQSSSSATPASARTAASRRRSAGSLSAARFSARYGPTLSASTSAPSTSARSLKSRSFARTSVTVSVPPPSFAPKSAGFGTTSLPRRKPSFSQRRRRARTVPGSTRSVFARLSAHKRGSRLPHQSTRSRESSRRRRTSSGSTAADGRGARRSLCPFRGARLRKGDAGRAARRFGRARPPERT